MTSIVWFRRDLRLSDNPALYHAASAGKVIPVFIHEPKAEAPWAAGSASRWWLHHSLTSLSRDIRDRGNSLIIRQGDTLETLIELCQQTGADKVYWNHHYEPQAINLESKLKTVLAKHGIQAQSFNSQLLYNPDTILNKSGKPYRVFGAFWKTCQQRGLPSTTLSMPDNMATSDKTLPSLTPEQLGLLPTKPWDSGLKTTWQVGEAHAHNLLDEFCEDRLHTYSLSRDYPAEPATSRLAAPLHFGEISARQVVAKIQGYAACNTQPGLLNAAEHFIRELGWREFAHYILFHFPETICKPFDQRYSAFPYNKDPHILSAWQKGQTGFPIVDAGMRELWHTGSMHNRVRMIVASLLTKHAQIHWLEGARWFWDTLIDADLASNIMNWQWVAGCGVDAAPYFRIFNPISQSQRFDPVGRYLRQWLPELASLPDKHIHAPWQAPTAVLAKAGITLGETYPLPVLDLKQGRAQALSSYRRYIMQRQDTTTTS